MENKTRILSLLSILSLGTLVHSIILNKPSQPITVAAGLSTTPISLVNSGLGGFLQMIQEFGSLKIQMNHQEETNRVLVEKVASLEKLLNQVKQTAVEETQYLAENAKVRWER